MREESERWLTIRILVDARREEREMGSPCEMAGRGVSGERWPSMWHSLPLGIWGERSRGTCMEEVSIAVPLTGHSLLFL